MSSGFITESEIIEERRRRQEEWDKVRTPDQPKEAPEEVHDTRPLYHRLEEQRLKRDTEYEETHKLKNMIRGLDDDEVGFLDLVERTKAKAAQQINIEEQREMQEFRERVSNISETEEMKRLRAEITPARSANTKKANNLQGVIVKKRKASEVDNENNDDLPIKQNRNDLSEGTEQDHKSKGPKSALQCIGVLPGLGHYNSDCSTDTDASSDDEIEHPLKLHDVICPTGVMKKKHTETESS